MEPSDLNICRSVRYTKGWRKGAVRCTQCGFYFIPDSQGYPLYDGEPAEYLTGIEWFAQFKCCPNCQPAEPTAPFGKRRCLGQKAKYNWTSRRGCGVLFPVASQRDSIRHKWGNSKSGVTRICHCLKCNPRSSDGNRTRIAAINKCKNLAARLGRSPTYEEFIASRLSPSISVIQMYWGNYNSFIAACGFEPRTEPIKRSRLTGHRVYTDDEMFDALRLAHEENGHVISSITWNQQHRKPNDKTIRNRLGGWRKAWLMIGVEPLHSASDGSPEAKQLIYTNLQKMNANHLASPTARDMWQLAHGNGSESTKRYLDAMDYHAEKLAEQERIFKEHQFKSKDDNESSG